MAQPQWYAMRVRRVDESKGEPRWSIGANTVAGDEPFLFRTVLYLTVVGRRVEAQPTVVFLSICLVGLGYLALWTILPRPLMERKGYVLDPLLTWFLSSVVGGSVCTVFGIPAQMGIQWAAVIWGNIPHFGYFTSGIVPKVRYIASRVGLTVVIARAGFAIHLGDVKTKWQNVLWLSFLPLIGEATAHALLAQHVFHLPDYRWAFLQGFLASAVAPGIVVPGLLMLRQEGIGVTGPSSTIMTSCVFDSVFAVWIVSFLSDLIFSDKPLGLAIALGPIQLIGGFVLGMLLAPIFHWTVRLFLSEYALVPDASGALHYPPEHLGKIHAKVVALFSSVALSLVVLGDRVHLFGGGCIAVLGFAGTVSQLWAPLPPAEAETRLTDIISPTETCTSDTCLSELCLTHGAPKPLTPAPAVGPASPFHEFSQVANTTQTEHGAPEVSPRHNLSLSPDAPDRIEEQRHPLAEATQRRVPDPFQTPSVQTDSDSESESEEQKHRRQFFVNQRGLLFRDYAWVWENVAMPAMFSFSGTTVQLTAVFGAAFFPKAIGVLLLGVFIRFMLAIPSGIERGGTRTAAVYVGFAWIGKATIQSALAGIAVDNVASMTSVPRGWKEAAATVQQMALLGAILFAPVNAVLTVALGRLWLSKDNRPQ